MRQRIVSASVRRKASRYDPGDGVDVAVSSPAAEQRVERRVRLDVPVIDELAAPDRDPLRDDDDPPLQVLLQRGTAVDDERSIAQCFPTVPKPHDWRIMISPWVVAGWCLAAYLIGGLPVGWLLVRRKRYGLDLRKFGTGNIGTSNVYRHAGIDIAIIVGPLQFAAGIRAGAGVAAWRGCR